MKIKCAKIIIMVMVVSIFYCATDFVDAVLQPAPEGVSPNISGSVGTSVSQKNLKDQSSVADFFKKIFSSSNSQLNTTPDSATKNHEEKNDFYIDWVKLATILAIVIIIVIIIFIIIKNG